MEIDNDFWILFILTIIIITIPFNLIKLSLYESFEVIFVLSIIFYIWLAILYRKLLGYRNNGWIYPCLNVISILTILLLDLYYFKSNITNIQLLGIFFAVISSCVLLYSALNE